MFIHLSVQQLSVGPCEFRPCSRQIQKAGCEDGNAHMAKAYPLDAAPLRDAVSQEVGLAYPAVCLDVPIGVSLPAGSTANVDKQQYH